MGRGISGTFHGNPFEPGGMIFDHELNSLQTAFNVFKKLSAAGESERLFFSMTPISLVRAGVLIGRLRRPVNSTISKAEEGRIVTPSPALTMPAAVDI